MDTGGSAEIAPTPELCLTALQGLPFAVIGTREARFARPRYIFARHSEQLIALHTYIHGHTRQMSQLMLELGRQSVFNRVQIKFKQQ